MLRRIFTKKENSNMKKDERSLDFSKLQPGDILSETSYYTVKNIYTDHVDVEVGGEVMELGNGYLEKLVKSANQYESEVKLSRTDVINILKANPRTACSIYYRKKDEEKGKRAYEAEKTAKIQEIQSATLANAAKLLEDLIDNPISKFTPGDMRLIKGYHENGMDTHGRLMFSDAEAKDKDGNFIVKGVDTRTIEYIIVNRIKYTKK
jgi:hypothetical protein